MPWNPDNDPPIYETPEQARKGAFEFIRKMGRIIGRIIPHRSKGIYNDQGQRIGVEYETTRGVQVKIRQERHPTPSERQHGITESLDLKIEGMPARHFSSRRIKKKRK